MDFSQVKSLTIPEGDVTKIEIGGVTVWEKRPDNWGTLTYGTPSQTYQIMSETDFNALCTNSATIHFSDGTNISKYDVTGFIFGGNCPTTINGYFLASCHSLSSTINVPSGVTAIGDWFLYECNSVGTVTLPQTLTTIGNYFLSDCANYDYSLVIPGSVTTIGSHFLAICDGFHQRITVPAAVTSIGGHFMFKCPIEAITVETTVSPTDNYSFSGETWTWQLDGLSLYGAGARAWANALPDLSGPSLWRKVRNRNV